jgi:aminoglycoside phosphotransferase (APT) family kinase protein
MATIGDPLTDLALMLVYSRLGADRVAGLSDVSTAPGFLDERSAIERYSLGSGRDLSNVGFYLGLAAFKLAVILEGIHFRHRNGHTVGEGFDGIGDAIEPLLAAGVTAVRESA